MLDEQIHEFKKFEAGIFNVGGGLPNAISLKELTFICSEITGNSIQINEDKKQREGDIRIYVTDNSKLYKTTSWRPSKSVETTMDEIYKWINDNEAQLKSILF